jgi:hypothetical protein
MRRRWFVSIQKRHAYENRYIIKGLYLITLFWQTSFINNQNRDTISIFITIAKANHRCIHPFQNMNNYMDFIPSKLYEKVEKMWTLKTPRISNNNLIFN